ncbi:hypothetical protein SK803_32390 [Lentzea sp. BCCO 10_0856]|uniref:Uncharacterized protein n=1 Tax=Lentzea miocenica TaxID=3095431 RepID=A0ABU4T9T6_9PSEU|nr:hypothetical protein [Lentzea sp. BCCO 10_0856]MDX8034940.1 hypothetical protein [Lentzea sp. BCCO 10_0856]
MSRSLRSAAAGLLTVLLCLGLSTAPVLADDRNPAGPTATVTSSTTIGAGGTRLALSGPLTLLLGAGLALLARQGPNGPGSRRT